jgi:hypothetical protein
MTSEIPRKSYIKKKQQKKGRTKKKGEKKEKRQNGIENKTKKNPPRSPSNRPSPHRVHSRLKKATKKKKPGTNLLSARKQAGTPQSERSKRIEITS